MATAMASNQPIQFGSSGNTSGGVTLTFSPSNAPEMTRNVGAASGSTYYRRQMPNRQFNTYQQDILMGDGPGRRLRKNVANVRRHVDYVSNILNHLDARLWQYGRRQRPVQQPDELYQNTSLPAWCTTDVPVDCVLTKFVRAAMNKVKCPVYSLSGKRLITGASTGEFTLWNGTAFNFETILQAHDSAVRAMTWSYNGQWLVSADHDGYIKYWQPNMNNVHMYQAHKDDPIRGLSFAPTDLKIVSASDDGTARIWDFARCTEERSLKGHGSEVRCVDWHPTKGLIVTGSRDSQQPVKLWDPKSGQCLSTLQDHKSSVMAVSWNKNGNWLLTGGRDHLIKMYDIRMMKEMHTFRGHKKEVTSLAWNPIHENLLVSGGGDGSIAYWLVGTEKEVGLLEHAHDQAIWAMQFHPKGHILSTGSNDNNTKFWARNRPGDTQEDIFGLASFTTNMVGALDKEREPKPQQVRTTEEPSVGMAIIPGMGLDEDVIEKMNRDISTSGSLASSTHLLVPEDLNSQKQIGLHNARRVLIKQPPPKKAQRQFERMWNVSKPGAVEDDIHEEEYRRPKGSLLGAVPPSMLGGQHGAANGNTEDHSQWNPGFNPRLPIRPSTPPNQTGPGRPPQVPSQLLPQPPTSSIQPSLLNVPPPQRPQHSPIPSTPNAMAQPPRGPPPMFPGSTPVQGQRPPLHPSLPIQMQQMPPALPKDMPPPPFPFPLGAPPNAWVPPTNDRRFPPQDPSGMDGGDIDYRAGPSHGNDSDMRANGPPKQVNDSWRLKPPGPNEEPPMDPRIRPPQQWARDGDYNDNSGDRGYNDRQNFHRDRDAPYDPRRGNRGRGRPRGRY